MKKIAIFASGSGSNAEEIIKHFQKSAVATVALILSNKPQAYVLQRAEKFNVPSVTFTRAELNDGSVLEILRTHEIDFVVLAGFMNLVPENLVKAYPNKIVNIHPALLPKFGGKGMYGEHVHRAVKESGDTQTGITIHFVNEKYDEGQIIHQSTCEVLSSDTPETIAEKVHQLEYKNYPKVIEEVITSA